MYVAVPCQKQPVGRRHARSQPPSHILLTNTLCGIVLDMVQLVRSPVLVDRILPQHLESLVHAANRVDPPDVLRPDTSEAVRDTPNPCTTPALPRPSHSMRYLWPS